MIGDISGWEEVAGTDWRCQAEITPHGGLYHFYANRTPPEGFAAELRQDVDVSADSDAIDDGTRSFLFSGMIGGWADHSTDASRITIEYYDAARSTVLARFDSGDVCCFGGWKPVSDQRIAPVGTRWVRIRLVSTFHYGGTNDGYHDDLTLLVE